MICEYCGKDIEFDSREDMCGCDDMDLYDYDYDVLEVGQYDTLEEKELDEEIDAINEAQFRS